MEIPFSKSRSPVWGSSLVAHSPTGRCFSGPWDGAFASSPASRGSPRTLYIDAAGLCFEDTQEALAESTPTSSDQSLEPESPRRRNMELARAMGLSPPQKGISEALPGKVYASNASQHKRNSNDSVRRSAALRQPRKMN